MITQENIPYTADEIMAMVKTCEKYNKARERASKLKVQNPFETVGQMVEHIFPELAESDGERIRKELIAFIKKRDRSGCDYDYDKWIAWLEKQGEKKPTDKVEPKFKIEKGKWYVCIKDLLDNYANKAFRKGDTYLSTKDGSLIPSNSNVPCKVVCCPDTYFRDWTIQDARDGDVLVASDGSIFLFAGVDDCACKYYAALTPDDVIVFDERLEHYWETSRAVHPASKEQRDLLFKKMQEAGYKWNAEKE